MSRENRSSGAGMGWGKWCLVGVVLLLVCFWYWGMGRSRVGGVEGWMERKRQMGERFTLEELGLDKRGGYRSGAMDVADLVAGRMKSFQHPPGPTESYRLNQVAGRQVVLWCEPQMISVAGFRAGWGMMEAELDGVEVELERVRRAVEVIVDDPGGALYPSQLKINAVAVRMVAQVLSDAVLLELHRGRMEAALENLVTLIRLARQHERDPVLFIQTFRLGLTELAVDGVWQALQWEGWTEEQLDLVRGELMDLELVSGCIRAFEVERAIALCFASDLEAGVGYWGNGSRFSLSRHAWKLLGREDDLMFLLRSYDSFLGGVRGFEGGGGKWELGEGLGTGGLGEAEPQLGVGGRWLGRVGFHYNYVVSGLLLPNFARSGELLVRAETRRRMALTWLEVELIRLERGGWPPALGALPRVDGEERWRTELFSGEPFGYRLREGGQPLLYSVGMDGVDGGGEFGDWVWPEPVGAER